MISLVDNTVVGILHMLLNSVSINKPGVQDRLTIDTIDHTLLIPLVAFTALDILSIPIRVGFLMHQFA
jgi:hypothetical protein